MKLVEKLWDQIIDYITNIELWISLGQGILKICLIFIIATAFIRIGKLAISKVFLFRGKSPIRISERRENTLARLLENILTYVVYFIAIIMVLETLGLDVAALLAGAGIVGLAVGFGAQNLVRDIITGFFIIFEDQFSVGDYVRISNFEGTVEEIGLRTSKIKSWTGEVHILPNGNITEVTNFSLNNSIAVVDISIAYESDIPKVERIIQELLIEIQDKYEDMIHPPELLGVQNLVASEVTLRVTCEVAPMKHFHIARMLRKDIKIRLSEKGIEIPYPRMVMYNRKEEVS
ncbi:mechanosensitive ion channel family protein [Metabacillus halosaccharovorans]|uniref:mechanosensitive ion channel family protein n=1 Tax=Metabacillus halosaccharovorans TaxID=930124 RepID=UPI001C1F6943|nr:mechanosensitive ion channel family protein [Metabacillus halosaccharovorans]MBU7594138.1 mechanosensitive ion channel family protein [Metabacillus halosaccharovorans]